jgi:hypothetical protein
VVTDVAAYLWTVRVLAACRGRDTVALERAAAPLPPRWVLGGSRGFAAARRRHAASCLIDAHLRQGWHAAGGDRRLLHLGVRPAPDGFAFHAWLDGDDDGAGFVTLTARTADGDLEHADTEPRDPAQGGRPAGGDRRRWSA